MFLIFLLFFATGSMLGNNVQVSNAVRTGAGRDIIQFDVSWDNSWYVSGVPSNHDAVWIFIKFRPCTGGDWNHALLSTTMTDHSFDADITYAKAITTTDRNGGAGNFNNGVMIRRNTIGTGNISAQSVSLKVVGSSTGVPLDAGTEYDIKVFAIEMVQIPQAAFQAGDGASSYTIYTPPTSTNPLQVTSEASVLLATSEWGYQVTLPANFPKGFSEFYIMKYEVTHGQYCDFLNTISGAAGVSRYYNNNNYMHDLQFSGGYYTNSVDRPVNYLNPNDILAYLDWAALRPMTELEFEKACRGPVGGIQDYAWGTTTKIEATNISGASAGVEICTDANANVNSGDQWSQFGGQFGVGTPGPVAAGIFARDATTTRETTGASFYGVMEMSGNLREWTVRVSRENNTNPSLYTGLWGDGQLSAAGLANVTNWPAAPDYYSPRGGDFWNSSTHCRVSDRSYYTSNDYITRDVVFGCRGVR